MANKNNPKLMMTSLTGSRRKRCEKRCRITDSDSKSFFFFNTEGIVKDIFIIIIISDDSCQTLKVSKE